jgi:NAD+ diphosphatase
MRPPNVFSGPYLDRASHLRQDPAWLPSALEDDRSRAIPVWNSRNLVTEHGAPALSPVPSANGSPASPGDVRAAFLPMAEIPAALRETGDLVLLGRSGGIHYFAYEMESADAPPSPPHTRFEDLRQVASLLPEEEAGLLSYARAMVSWRRRHRFCGSCGAGTSSAKNGHVLVCTNPTCRHEQFPRIDPAIIVLVSDGERALLGRQASWPVGRYSTIAGFVEPGEALEDAVSREVLEETGIEVGAIEYHSSQPWPFPSSLMLGFTARAMGTNIVLRDQELEDARWFSRADVMSGRPLVPPSVSISFRLIEHWFNAGGGKPLREVLGGAVSWQATTR